MNGLSDQELLRQYAEHRVEAAFGELVRRYVDLVYSAALRMVRDTHLAEDVTQAVFLALSRNAGSLTERPVLSAWLHRTAHNLAANAVRSDVRRRAREQEVAVMSDLLVTEPEAAWDQVAPHLDAALSELTEPERDVVLLRYFERQSACEMAQRLGTSEEAAQKRLSRAVQHLRELLARRGVAAGASGLVAMISVNAVQAAPTGLALSISAAAVLAGVAASTSATSTSALVAMTTLQKAVSAYPLYSSYVLGHFPQRERRQEVWPGEFRHGIPEEHDGVSGSVCHRPGLSRVPLPSSLARKIRLPGMQWPAGMADESGHRVLRRLPAADLSNGRDHSP